MGIKTAGAMPLPYKCRIKSFVFYTAKPKFKRSGRGCMRRNKALKPLKPLAFAPD